MAATEQNTLLIAGGNGNIGRAIMRHFGERPSWPQVGLARRPPKDSAWPFVSADLLDPGVCAQALKPLAEDVTHIIYAARYNHSGGKPESASINGAMLRNLLDAVEPVAPRLKHIHLVHGTKYYGHAIRPSATPYRENDPRVPVELFYYEQQDLITERQRGNSWAWSISRPHGFCDLHIGEARSITLLIAVYATVLRELGLPLIYPGTRASFEARTQFTWLPMLARSIEWMMSTPACANQAYNVVNGDALSWAEMWPMIARYFDMEAGGPEGGSFEQFAVGKNAVWQESAARHGLSPLDLSTDVQWAYGDYFLSLQWDVVSDMSKAARDGFTETVDTRKMWMDSFDFYRRNKLIP